MCHRNFIRITDGECIKKQIFIQKKKFQIYSEFVLSSSLKKNLDF